VDAAREEYVAECFWPDVERSDLAALDERIDRAVASRASVRYLGAILLREDEVVLCRFEGTAADVRDVAERAQIPFDRLLTAAHSPWPLSSLGGIE
jgi:hypothetical protein